MDENDNLLISILYAGIINNFNKLYDKSSLSRKHVITYNQLRYKGNGHALVSFKREEFSSLLTGRAKQFLTRSCIPCMYISSPSYQSSSQHTLFHNL